MSLSLSEPRVLKDITRLPGLPGITVSDDVVTIGALTRHAEIAGSETVRAHLRLLAQAVAHVAYPAIRNRGMIGGSLALNDPATEYPAVALALGATMAVRGAGGTRPVPASAFYAIIDAIETVAKARAA